MERVHMVVDAARAAHISNVGQFGSGFLTDPKQIKETMSKLAVGMVKAADLLPPGTLVSINAPAVGSRGATTEAALRFPQTLGQLGLGHAPRLQITVVAENHRAGTYSVKLRGALQYLENFKNGGVGIVSPRVPIAKEATHFGKDAKEATHFCWAYPMRGGRPEILGYLRYFST
jgi:hypothetical protein